MSLNDGPSKLGFPVAIARAWGWRPTQTINKDLYETTISQNVLSKQQNSHYGQI